MADTFLGHFPEISLHQARQASRRKRKELGQEPPKGYTLNDAFKLWCNLKRNRISSYKDEKRRLERHIISKIGSRQIDEITAPLVIYTVAPIEKAGHQATLKRVLLRTREILDLAVCAGYIPHNPINRVSKVFAPPKVTSMASIPWQELPELFSVAKAAPIRIQVLLFWSCLSLLRPHEAVKIRSDWIDGQTLIIPSTEMKRKREHRVPLNDISLATLQLARSLSPHPKSPFIWSGRAKGTHTSKQTLAKFLHSTCLKNRLVAHGIRSIGRSWLADHDAPFEASEACLAHLSGSVTSRSYQRSDYLAIRRSLMDEWSRYVLDCARRADFLPQITQALSE